LRHSTSGNIWNMEPGLLVSDEMLYYHAITYTATYPLIRRAQYNSLVQPTLYYSNDRSNELIDAKQKLPVPVKAQLSQTLDLSVLVIMSTMLQNRADVDKAADIGVLAGWHGRSVKWAVTCVLQPDESEEEGSLRSYLNGKLNDEALKEVEFSTVAREGRYSKFEFVKTQIFRMADFDKVLLKDADQRVSGFPWKTFVDKLGTAVIAGALRQAVEEGLIRRKFDDNAAKRQFFQYNDAENWKKTSAEGYLKVQPEPVNFIEQYFILADGKFAAWYFDKILRPEYTQTSGCWGPDIMWCGAAHDWLINPGAEEDVDLASSSKIHRQKNLARAPPRRLEELAKAKANRQACVLIPVVTSHEDSRQINRGDAQKKYSSEGLAPYMEAFPEWIAYSKSDRQRLHIAKGSDFHGYTLPF
jgi:hypothetical protein